MDYLNFDRIFYVHRRDIFYVRKARHVEVGPLDDNIEVFRPLSLDAGVVVFRDHRKRRFITEMRLDDLVSGGLPFVDLGAGRYVPAANIREIIEAPDGARHDGSEVWIEGQPYAVCLQSALPLRVLLARWETAMARLPDAPIPGGVSVRLPNARKQIVARGSRMPANLAA